MRQVWFATLCCAGLGTAPISAAAHPISFRVIDRLDPSELSEVTTLFVNGVQVARFTLDTKHQGDMIDITVPEALQYDYALCGRIIIRGTEGQAETHVLDTGATLDQVAGRDFEAMAGSDFALFYLADSAAPKAGPPADLHRTQVCDIPET